MRTEYIFSDEALRAATAQLVEARLAMQPSPAECEHQFSERFEQAMDKLIQRARRIAMWHRVAVAAASLLLALLIGAGAVLIFNQEARASFVTWLRERYEYSILYHFWGNGDTSEFPTYQLSWVPDGFELVQEMEREYRYMALYQSTNSEEQIIFTYATGEAWGGMMIFGDVDNSEQLMIRGLYAEYVLAEDGSSGDLMLISEDQRTIFVISSTLEKDTIIELAEGIILVK